MKADAVGAGQQVKTFPRRFWLGVALVAVAWPLNWLPIHPLRTAYLFFPLWLGYILAVDGLVWRRHGTSLYARSPRAFAGLFLVSAPAWWLFEVLNWRLQNWQYLGREQFSDLAYALLASLSFSTVIPAVFGTAELVSGFRWVRRLGRGPVIRPTRRVTVGFFLAGLVTLALMLLWPRYFFPFMWLSVYFLLAPVNVWLGHRSLATYTAVGNWRPIIALWLGGVICGFFWELWNLYAYPKWVYHIPFVGFWRVFEMPLLGYGGYLPFAMELFALYHLVIGLLGLSLHNYVQLEARETSG
jgi:hypothetical protein